MSNLHSIILRDATPPDMRDDMATLRDAKAIQRIGTDEERDHAATVASAARESLAQARPDVVGIAKRIVARIDDTTPRQDKAAIRRASVAMMLRTARALR